jgi:hypothetical protein
VRTTTPPKTSKSSTKSTISLSATSIPSSSSTTSSKHSVLRTNSVSQSSSTSSSPKSSSTSPPITSCTLSSVATLSTAYPAYTIDYPATIACNCNDGWTAGVANTVGSDGATTYYCEIGTTHIEVSTASKTIFYIDIAWIYSYSLNYARNSHLLREWSQRGRWSELRIPR